MQRLSSKLSAFLATYSWQVLLALLIVISALTPAGRALLNSPDQVIKLLQATAWPAIVALGLILLFATRGGRTLLTSLPGRVSKVSAFGVELDLTVEVAREVRESATHDLDEYRQRINNEFDRQVATKQIDDLRILVIEKSVEVAISKGWMKQEAKGDYRSTIHVRDVLFHDAMYQLLDYYPIGGGRSRAFSIRRGILGRAWRLVDNQVEGSVPTDSATLIKEWAMTAEEAAFAARERQSFACILLKDGAAPIGVLYLDSKVLHAFGSDEKTKTEIANLFRQTSDDYQLTHGIAMLHKEMRDVGPALTLFV